MTRLPRHKRFEYTPRHYDPDKEELEDRIRQIKQEMGYEIERTPGTRTTIRRGSFRKAREQAKVRASRASNIRLVVILALLLFIAYFIFFS